MAVVAIKYPYKDKRASCEKCQANYNYSCPIMNFGGKLLPPFIIAHKNVAIGNIFNTKNSIIVHVKLYNVLSNVFGDGGIANLG